MTTCPKCHYTRQPDDTAPDYECPRCGLVYAKYKPPPAPAPVVEKAAPVKEYRKGTPICASCGTLDATRTNTPGSIFIEIILWIVLIIPGVIYSIWRHMARKKVCAECGGTELLPIGTPRGRELLEQHHPTVRIKG